MAQSWNAPPNLRMNFPGMFYQPNGFLPFFQQPMMPPQFTMPMMQPQQMGQMQQRPMFPQQQVFAQQKQNNPVPPPLPKPKREFIRPAPMPQDKEPTAGKEESEVKMESEVAIELVPDSSIGVPAAPPRIGPVSVTLSPDKSEPLFPCELCRSLVSFPPTFNTNAQMRQHAVAHAEQFGVSTDSVMPKCFPGHSDSETNTVTPMETTEQEHISLQGHLDHSQSSHINSSPRAIYSPAMSPPRLDTPPIHSILTPQTPKSTTPGKAKTVDKPKTKTPSKPKAKPPAKKAPITPAAKPVSKKAAGKPGTGKATQSMKKTASVLPPANKKVQSSQKTPPPSGPKTSKPTKAGKNAADNYKSELAASEEWAGSVCGVGKCHAMLPKDRLQMEIHLAMHAGIGILQCSVRASGSQRQCGKRLFRDFEAHLKTAHLMRSSGNALSNFALVSGKSAPRLLTQLRLCNPANKTRTPPKTVESRQVKCAECKFTTPFPSDRVDLNHAVFTHLNTHETLSFFLKCSLCNREWGEEKSFQHVCPKSSPTRPTLTSRVAILDDNNKTLLQKYFPRLSAEEFSPSKMKSSTIILSVPSELKSSTIKQKKLGKRKSS